MKLKINDIDFDVQLYEEPQKDQDTITGIDMYEPNNCGVTYRCKGKVFINSEIADDQQFTTIIHEIAHCYIWAYGFAQIEWKEEVVCDFIAANSDSILEDSVRVYNELFKGRRK